MKSNGTVFPAGGTAAVWLVNTFTWCVALQGMIFRPSDHNQGQDLSVWAYPFPIRTWVPPPGLIECWLVPSWKLMLIYTEHWVHWGKLRHCRLTGVRNHDLWGYEWDTALPTDPTNLGILHMKVVHITRASFCCWRVLKSNLTVADYWNLSKSFSCQEEGGDG